MATIAQLGLAQSIVKFMPEMGSGSEKRKQFLGFIFLIIGVGYLVLLGITYVFKEPIQAYYSTKSPLFVEYFQVSIVIALLLVLIQISEAYSRSLLRSVPPIFIRDVLLRILTTSSVLLYGFGIISFEKFINLFVVLYGLALSAHIIHFASIGALQLRFKFNQLPKKKMGGILKYGGYTLIGATGSQIVLQIDSLMIAGIEGLDATGIYTIAFFMAQL